MDGISQSPLNSRLQIDSESYIKAIFPDCKPAEEGNSSPICWGLSS